MGLVLLLAAFSGPGHVRSDFQDYHTYQELTTALNGLASSHSNLARVQSIGESAGGRDLWLLELANRDGTPVEQRPALLIAANFEGNQVAGSELALGTVNWLLTNYGTDEEATRALDEHVIYVVPRMNPDGAEKMFASVQTGSTTNNTPYDDDNDARTDEDGPNDLNGDGLITMMRVPDPNGASMIDPDDERLMKEADPKKGETGTHAIYWEGTDDDNDGFYNEDPVGGIDLNRNFQHEYPYYQRGAGLHMISENESRALMDFVVNHRNIGLMLVFGPNDNLITAVNNKGELGSAAGIDLFAFADDSFAEAGEVGPDAVARVSVELVERPRAGRVVGVADREEDRRTRGERIGDAGGDPAVGETVEVDRRVEGVAGQPCARGPEGAQADHAERAAGLVPDAHLRVEHRHEVVGAGGAHGVGRDGGVGVAEGGEVVREREVGQPARGAASRGRLVGLGLGLGVGLELGEDPVRVDLADLVGQRRGLADDARRLDRVARTHHLGRDQLRPRRATGSLDDDLLLRRGGRSRQQGGGEAAEHGRDTGPGKTGADRTHQKIPSKAIPGRQRPRSREQTGWTHPKIPEAWPGTKEKVRISHGRCRGRPTKKAAPAMAAAAFE